ncbi:hypothetical protein CLH62_01875 [Marinobacter guineae]|uniref:Ice-binding protein C-terminal domain-containing protein n=1 Tax=Marinobacter guineae TaxID=432303 RepID=A0A2G1VIF1_9GAMM|nr:PEP-CTERM sorting domain-containing protein [Marinobacter guineae]PHQ26370.1 hypothetical protein CLH62_01875 [Marinobacter guineae]
MKLLTRSLLCTVIASVSVPASAVLITKDVAYGSANAAAAEQAFRDGTSYRITETFNGIAPNAIQDPDNDGYESFVVGNQQRSWVLASSSFNTSVGTFQLTQAETSPNSDDVQIGDLMIEDKKTGEFGREFAGNWLDSNDAATVTWSVMDGAAGNRNALGFYLSDSNDINASLKLEFADGTVSDEIQITSPLADNNLAYVTIFSDVFFTSAMLTFNNGTGTNDGWGLDNVAVAKVPEPGTLALLGLGLAAMGISRRRKLEA